MTDRNDWDGACPHADIRFCPLYHAAHGIEGLFGHGCSDGLLHEGGCAVDRGLDYAQAVAALRALRPRYVAMLEFNEDAERRRQQRARNMRAAGIQ